MMRQALLKRKAVRFAEEPVSAFIVPVDEDADLEGGVMSENDTYLNNLILSPITPVTANLVTTSLFATKPTILTMICQASGQTCEGTEEVD